MRQALGWQVQREQVLLCGGTAVLPHSSPAPSGTATGLPLVLEFLPAKLDTAIPSFAKRLGMHGGEGYGELGAAGVRAAHSGGPSAERGSCCPGRGWEGGCFECFQDLSQTALPFGDGEFKSSLTHTLPIPAASRAAPSPPSVSPCQDTFPGAGIYSPQKLPGLIPAGVCPLCWLSLGYGSSPWALLADLHPAT